jgi:hypothetical protein
VAVLKKKMLKKSKELHWSRQWVLFTEAAG